jgi:hypothetical protein
MNNKIVYLHRKKTNNSVFYVGIGNNSRAYSKQRSKRWFNIVKKHDYYIDIIAKNLNNEDALELESFLIEIYGRLDLKNGQLVNMTNGGPGASGLSCSIKERRNYILSKVERSLEWKKKISNSHKGKVFSIETLKKMSDAKKGKKTSEDTIEKMKKSNRSKEISGVKINMFCFNTGELLYSFDSISSASKFIERPHACVSNTFKDDLKYRTKFTTIKKTNQKVIFKKQFNE